ncbi:protein translocase subunit SecF [Corynebacterium freiburgense]|uniref:protein translocase subunit SecF n=1 Tax=Corynebacterium freiburgense TaxID=556548 RepID=UPI0003FFA0E0|nr:protein translocase subunit SecF [Corynebacterium freiburgense]WJZ02821.1 preprotein translocase subunit SecF [Corynebacterium freiburgense]
MSSTGTIKRLYTGEGGVDFVGRRRLWYTITGIVLVVCFLAIAIRGFTLGIDFQGGTKMNMPADNLETTQVEKVFTDATGVDPVTVQIVGAGDSRILEINSERLSDEQITSARDALFTEFQPKGTSGSPSAEAIGDSTVSESWGSTITYWMLISLGLFLALIFVYIALRFERDMAISALSALGVDAIVIAGVYALIGFEVTPATIIGLLTVLAFSLYDTVVVFDKVKENTAGFESTTRRTYGELSNLAINQTVMRSISTTVISALPILALMVVAVWLMGVGTLKDLALVQLIGVIEGTFSSVFLATPFLVSLKNRQKKIKRHNARVDAVRNGAAPEEEERQAELVSTSEFTRNADGKRIVTTPAGPETTNNSNTSSGKSWRPGAE